VLSKIIQIVLTVTGIINCFSVATVNATGMVTAVANGSAAITVTTTDGSTTATSIITENSSSIPPFDSTNIIGYAAVSGEGYTTTTGGAGGSSITISTLADLQTWVSNREDNTTPEIVYIDTKIFSSSSIVLTIKHGANITIYGVGNSGELQNIGLNIRDYKNVIVRNMKIHEVLYPNDAITIDECQHVWIDHCELYSKIGPGITVDTYDGLLDIKKGSRYVTVSWCYLHDHMKCSLIGHTDNANQQATDSLIRVTYHHNWFSYTDGRNPSIRFGAIHMFNNYFEEITDYGLAARDGAHAKLENNLYYNVNLPMSTDKFPVDGLPNGYICESGTLLSGTTGSTVISQTGCNFWDSTTLPYPYSLDSTSDVASIVKANTGIGKVTYLNPGVESGYLLLSGSNEGQKPNLCIFPSPFEGNAIISFTLDKSFKVQIKLFSIMGKQIAVITDHTCAKGYNEIVYSNQGLLPGVYILSIKYGSVSEQTKIIVK
jgi:pectate lyase